ncbi:HIT family protein [Curtobacterium sp. MCPF17_051]|nr:HIT family protein [Curtobacterium sp. MCPF17_051]
MIALGEDPDAIIVYEDEETVAFVPLQPATRGHTLVIPKTHASRLWDLGGEDAATVMRTVLAVADSLQRALQPEGLNVIQSNGAAATQTIEHVHVHLVPRWRRDRMVLRWPKKAAESPEQQRITAAAIRVKLEGRSSAASLPVNSPEDRRQHLGFIQGVISRMASASASAKTWLLPIVTAAYGFAFVEHSWPIAALGIAAVAVFALLDANYLKQERSFRALYDHVAGGGPIPPFSMNPTVAGPTDNSRVNYWPDLQDWKSWAIAPFYSPFLLAGGALVTYIVGSS